MHSLPLQSLRLLEFCAPAFRTAQQCSEPWQVLKALGVRRLVLQKPAPKALAPQHRHGCEPARKQKGTSREPTGNQPRANSEPTANQQRTSTKPAVKPRQGNKNQQQNHWQHGSEIDVSKQESNNESTVNQQGTTMEPAWKQQQTRRANTRQAVKPRQNNKEPAAKTFAQQQSKLL